TQTDCGGIRRIGAAVLHRNSYLTGWPNSNISPAVTCCSAKVWAGLPDGDVRVPLTDVPKPAHSGTADQATVSDLVVIRYPNTALSGGQLWVVIVARQKEVRAK